MACSSLVRWRYDEAAMTERQHRFLAEYQKNGGNAYRSAKTAGYTESTARNATREVLGKSRTMQEALLDLRERYLRDAEEAYAVQLKLLRNPKTPAQLRTRIASEIQDRAGLSAPTKEEHLVKTESFPILPERDQKIAEAAAEDLKKLIEKYGL